MIVLGSVPEHQALDKTRQNCGPKKRLNWEEPYGLITPTMPA